MSKRFPFNFLKVSDALNGIVAVKRHAAALNPANFKSRSNNGKAIFALSIVCFFWGTTWIATRQGVLYMPALQMAGLRQCIGGALYIIFFLFKKAVWPSGREWWPILMLSFLNFILSNTLSTWGVKYISAGLGSVIGAIFPLWLVIIALAGSKSGMNRKAVVGLAVGFTGICVVFYQHLQDFFNAGFRLGIFLSVLSTWSWAFGTLYTKQQATKFNPYFALGLQMVISGPVIYLVSQITNNAVPFLEIPWESWAAIIYLVVFGSVISFVAYLYALQNLPTEQVSIYAYINPVVALFAGALLFNERLTLAIIVGVCITLYGVRLVNKATKESIADDENG